jgi:hypothetical protein
MSLSDASRDAAIRAREVYLRLNPLFDHRIPPEFSYADRSQTLLYSSALAHRTGSELWIAAAREEGFWVAMDSAARCICRRMVGNPAGPEEPIVGPGGMLLRMLAGNPSHAQLIEIVQGSIPYIEADATFFDQMAKARLKRGHPKGAVSWKDSFGEDDDPSWSAIRGWTSHHYWLMKPNVLIKLIKGMNENAVKKLFSRHGLISHLNPPIEEIKDGVDLFSFRAGWKGVRPTPTAIRDASTFL